MAGIGVFFGDDDLRFASSLSSDSHLNDGFMSSRCRNVSERLEGDRQTNQRAELMVFDFFLLVDLLRDS